MRSLAKIIATSLGFGYAPFAPGTFGTLFGCIILLILWNFSVGFLPYQIFIIIGSILFFMIGVWATNLLESEWGHDPGKIVIDETVGLWLTCFLIPLHPTYILIAFILFRFFDILKPLGIKKFEKIKGGYGVMLDDIIAGIYSNILLQIIYRFHLLPDSWIF